MDGPRDRARSWTMSADVTGPVEAPPLRWIEPKTRLAIGGLGKMLEASKPVGQLHGGAYHIPRAGDEWCLLTGSSRIGRYHRQPQLQRRKPWPVACGYL